jgi:hypothetical protein
MPNRRPASTNDVPDAPATHEARRGDRRRVRDHVVAEKSMYGLGRRRPAWTRGLRGDHRLHADEVDQQRLDQLHFDQGPLIVSSGSPAKASSPSAIAHTAEVQAQARQAVEERPSNSE